MELKRELKRRRRGNVQNLIHKSFCRNYHGKEKYWVKTFVTDTWRLEKICTAEIFALDNVVLWANGDGGWAGLDLWTKYDGDGAAPGGGSAWGSIPSLPVGRESVRSGPRVPETALANENRSHNARPNVFMGPVWSGVPAARSHRSWWSGRIMRAVLWSLAVMNNSHNACW